MPHHRWNKRIRFNLCFCIRIKRNSRKVDQRIQSEEDDYAIRRSISQSANELHQFHSPDGETSFPKTEYQFRSEGCKQRKHSTGKSRLAFINTLKTMLGPSKGKDRKRLIESTCNSQVVKKWMSEASMERQDSMAGYGGDTSSVDQSSSGTPYSSPLHGPRHHIPASPKISYQSLRQRSETSIIAAMIPPIPENPKTESLDAANVRANFAQMESYQNCSMEASCSPRIRALREHSFFQLHVHLKRGVDLVPRDTCGTSDPYVKFKVGGKVVFKSKTVYKDLNPIWDETFSVGIEDPFEPVQIKVFDYDWGLQDDFMGLANIDLTMLDLNKLQDLSLTLHEPGKHEYMGTVLLSLTLVPKTQEERDQVRNLTQLFSPNFNILYRVN